MCRIADKIRQILDRIHEIEHAYGREDGAVTLLAVSKKQPAERVRAAYDAGLRDFGENYLQEAEEKITVLPLPGVRWHFIGPLQSNKTRRIAALFDWVHSIDRLKVATRLSEQRPAELPPLNVCIQINLANEATKSGVDLASAIALAEQIDALPRLQLRGLMTIPAPVQGLEQQRKQFRQLRFRHFDTLSMGMSDDFEAAIAEGSTLVRIGTALFGPRD